MLAQLVDLLGGKAAALVEHGRGREVAGHDEEAIAMSPPSTSRASAMVE